MAELKNDTLVIHQHYPAIDGLRGLAVLMVIWFHASNFTYDLLQPVFSGYGHAYYVISLLGQTGVDLFFVLSGFLITGILIDTAAHTHKYKNFIIRRSLRIFPLYYVYLLIFVVFTLSLGGGWPILSDIIPYLFYLQNWHSDNRLDAFMHLNHTWSLAVEEQFYIIWPFLFWAAYKKSYKCAIALTLTLIALSCGLRFYIWSLGEYKLAATTTLTRMDGLATGALVSILLKHHYALIVKYLRAAQSVAFLGLCTVLFTISNAADPVNAHLLIIKVGLCFVPLIYAVTVIMCVLPSAGGLFKKICTGTALQNIGKHSYGIYVFHMPVCIIAAQLTALYIPHFWSAHLIVLALTAVFTYAAAVLSYQYIEKPMLGLKESFAPLRRVDNQ